MNSEFKKTFFNSANDSNPEGELALSVLVSNIIEIATAHANSLGIGNPSMSHLGAGWVLSRITVEMDSYPPCNSEYSIITWIEGWNRHFSTRDFCIEDKDGNVYGYVRSVWMVLNTETHENFGLSHLKLPEEMISEKECPIPTQGKHVEIMPHNTPVDDVPARALKANIPETEYTFKYNDIDFYRHVNTVRYITILLNQYTLEEFDHNFVKRMEISFLHEGSFGDTVTVLRHNHSPFSSSISLKSHKTGLPILYSRLILASRNN